MRKLTAKEGQDLVSIIRESAIQAGRTYERQGQAFEAERMAEVAILEKAIELARPGLPAVCSKIEGILGFEGANLIEGLWILDDSRLATIAMPAPLIRSLGAERKVVPLTATDALEEATLPEILRPLADLFAKQVKGRESSTLAAEKRAAKLVALAELVDSF
jgi:hypothetical protein